MYVQDEQFGKIVDYDWLRGEMYKMYDEVYPNYNMLQGAINSTLVGNDDPNLLVTIGASGLAYSIIVAAEEYEIAEKLKDNIFTLAWTEEHTGSDLLSAHTYATPMSDDPDERQYHVKGGKWLINCSFHADYHVVVAKIDPEQDGPRSLSFFLVPRSSCKNWERLDTHVLQGMVLTKFDIDGPGTLLGKAGHGLSILQRMAMPSKYQCSYMGVRMLKRTVPDALDHLATKTIFKEQPLNFSNVFRQMYNIALQAALYDFIFHRAVVYNTDGFLQFHGTMLKSFLLLRINEVLSQSLLVVGSKGFLAESRIGRNAFDSFVLPVFDGHYTINTLMTAKHAQRYLNADRNVDIEERLALLEEELYISTQHGEINNRPQDIRKPPFYNYVHYIEKLGVPLDLKPEVLVNTIKDVLAEIDANGLASEPEYKYKTGDFLHWLESIIAACELWRLAEDDNYLNAIVMQYNATVNTINNVISEGGFQTEFLMPLRQVPISGDTSDPRAFLMRLFDIETLLKKVPVA